jgi:hypothetical protein
VLVPIYKTTSVFRKFIDDRFLEGARQDGDFLHAAFWYREWGIMGRRRWMS